MVTSLELSKPPFQNLNFDILHKSQIYILDNFILSFEFQNSEGFLTQAYTGNKIILKDKKKTCDMARQLVDKYFYRCKTKTILTTHDTGMVWLIRIYSWLTFMYILWTNTVNTC